MKVGVLGSGEVAKVLASGFLKHGHEVMVGSRTPDKLAEWAAKNPKGSTGTFDAAAGFGELLVLAVKGKAAADVLHLAGAENIKGKTVMDACNPIADAPPENGVLKLSTSSDQSLMEQLQRDFAAAHFVKAFNSVGSDFMVDPKFDGGKPTMFICGNDESAKQTVTTLLDEFGWDVADMGSAVSARAIEPLCVLWCLPGFLRNEWAHAFKLLKK